jgi:uncharacterized protein YkwD
MNYIDLIIVITLIIFALEGYKRPLFSEIFDLMSFLTAFLMSLRYYNLASEYLESTFSLPHSLANVLGFITIWYLIEVIIFILARFSLKKQNKALKIPAKDYVSMVPSTLKGLIFVSILLVLTATFPIQPKIKKDVNDSQLGSYILDKTYKLESPLKSVFGGLANDTLTFLTVKPESNQSIGLGFKNSNFFFDESLESEMIKLVNQERAANGLKALTYDPTLRPIGRDHSSDMFKRGYFSHYSPEGDDVADRADKYGINYLVIGENLAYAPTLEAAHNGLMNSPGHRANILSPEYHKIGIGVANGAEYGLMITQVFSN